MTKIKWWKTQYNQYLQAFFWNLILAVITFGFFMIQEKGLFTLSYDFDSQIVPFTKLSLDVLHGQSGIWNWNIDLGTSVVNAMSYYNLGSPFFWLFSWCDGSKVLYMLGWEYVLKYAVAGLGAYCFLRRYTSKHKTALAGSVLYAFSGFQAINLMFSIFHDAVALFPFLLIAFEELVENDRKKWFAVAVCFNALVNYYCFIGEVVFLILYYAIRYLISDWKKYVRKAGICIWEGCLGIGMASILFVPSIISVIQNSRVSQGINWTSFFSLSRRDILQYFLSFVVPSEMSMQRSCIYNEDWTSRSAYLPMIGVTLVLAYFMKRSKGNWLKRFLTVMIVLMVVPIGNGIFALFTTNYCRWFYMPILFMILASVKVVENWKDYPIKMSVLFMAFLLIAQYVIFHWWDVHKFELIFNDKRYTFLCVVALSGIVILGICCLLEHKDKIRMNLLLGGISLFAVMTTGYTCKLYQEFDHKDSFAYQNKIEILEEMEQEEGYRYLTEEDNISMLGKFKGINSFISTISGSIPEFWDSLGLEKVIFSPIGPSGTNELLSVKYRISRELSEDEQLIQTLQKDNEIYYLYQMKDYLNIGFTYDTYMTRSEFAKIPDEKRVLAMLHSLIIDDEEEETVSQYLQKADADLGVQLTENDISMLVTAHKKENASDFYISRDKFQCEIEADASKYAFFSVPYDKGWSATVNGKKTRIMDTNGFMAIRIEEGDNIIQFSFFDQTLLFAGILSAFFVIVWIIYGRMTRNKGFAG